VHIHLYAQRAPLTPLEYQVARTSHNCPTVPSPPEDVNRCDDLVTRTVIRVVHLKIDIRRCSEILARGMNRRRAAEAAKILAQCFRRDGSRRLVQHAIIRVRSKKY
jgi:hypothetical protein